MSRPVSLADSSLGKAINLAILENLSTTVNAVLPWETRRPVTKSIDMSAQGLEGMSSGCRNPIREQEDILFLAQIEHALTYFQTSDSMNGHQNSWERANIVCRTPGWQESSVEWAQWITCGHILTRTNNQFSGHPLGGRTSPFTCFTSFSICQVTAPTTQVSGRIGSGYLATGSGSKRRDRASGLICREPRLLEREKQKRLKK